MSQPSASADHESRGPEAPLRTIGLFFLFFLVCWGLGYPVLNRYDPREIPGMSDVQTYAAMVMGTAPSGEQHMRSRLLVPWLARPIFRLVEGRGGTWDPVMVGLLFSDSLFVAGTALLIVLLGARWGLPHSACLVAALLYLVNFAVCNLRLCGLVDGAEGFFLLALIASLSAHQLRWLPLISILGAASKESFVVFEAVLMTSWWLVARNKLESPFRYEIWLVASTALGLVSLLSVQQLVFGHWLNPVQLFSDLHRNREYLAHLESSLSDRNLWYIFIWLLPLSIPCIKGLPLSWIVPSIAMSAAALVLDNIYGGAPGTLGKALFTTAAPFLALSAARWLCGVRQQVTAEIHTG